MRAALLHACGEPPRPGERPEPVAGGGLALVATTAAPIARRVKKATISASPARRASPTRKTAER